MSTTMIAATPTLSSHGPVNSESESSALLQLHDSLIQDILSRTDIQSRMAASAACRRLARVSAEHPPSVVDLSSDGVHPEACRRFIENAKGAILTLITAGQQQRTACDATSARRFNTGVRCTQVVPYTSGLSAVRLAASLPNLQHLALHEATSCLGGMTDEFAVAIAANCPLLSSLEVAFTRYSLPSEFFTDMGMMTLAAGCPRLSSLSLTNCGAITDRSLYAVAVHCRGLQRLTLGGYHELISDYGTVVLFQACSGLVRVTLSGKLRRVTDESIEALAANSGAVLQEVKLTRSMGDRSLAALGPRCKALRMVDCCKCELGAITAAGVAQMLKALMSTMQTGPWRQQQQQLLLSGNRTDPMEGSVRQEPITVLEQGVTSSSSSSSSLSSSATATATATAAPGVGICVRVVLPTGIAAEEVVQLGSGGGGDNMAAAAAAAAACTCSSTRSGETESLLPSSGAAAGGVAPKLAAAATWLKLPSTGSGAAATAAAAAPASVVSYEEVVVRLL